MTQRKGYFVVLDGIDGSGKSTQAARLTRELAARGREVTHAREPGGTPYGEALRKALLDKNLDRGATAEILTLFASRAELLRQVIDGALERNSVVVCERWVSSTYAYQAAGSKGGLDLVAELEKWIVPRPPDRVFILDLTLAAARARMQRALDGIEARGDAYFERVRAGFLEYGSKHASASVVDASRSEEAVAAAILTQVLQDLD